MQLQDSFHSGGAKEGCSDTSGPGGRAWADSVATPRGPGGVGEGGLVGRWGPGRGGGGEGGPFGRCAQGPAVIITRQY